MTAELEVIAVHLVGAVLAGGIIGIERSFHARPAGFRTHTLVCLASIFQHGSTVVSHLWD